MPWDVFKVNQIYRTNPSSLLSRKDCAQAAEQDKHCDRCWERVESWTGSGLQSCETVFLFREKRGKGFPLQVRETLKKEQVRSIRSETQRVCTCVSVWLQEHDPPDKCQSELLQLQLFTEIKPSVKYPLRGFDLKLKGKWFLPLQWQVVKQTPLMNCIYLHWLGENIINHSCFSASVTILTQS